MCSSNNSVGHNTDLGRVRHQGKKLKTDHADVWDMLHGQRGPPLERRRQEEFAEVHAKAATTCLALPACRSPVLLSHSSHAMQQAPYTGLDACEME